MHILVYSMGTKATRRKAAVHYAALSSSRGNLKNLMPRSFTFVCQLYCYSSKHTNNKALRITFNSCKTVSTPSMALATVNTDKIIKVTSASSYVYNFYAATMPIKGSLYWSIPMLKRFSVAKKLSPVKIGPQNGGFSEI